MISYRVRLVRIDLITFKYKKNISVKYNVALSQLGLNITYKLYDLKWPNFPYSNQRACL